MVETIKPEINTKIPKKEKIVYNIEDREEEEELVFEKEHHNIVYKILKLNPFDPINDFVLKTLEKLDLTEKGYAFNWWLAYAFWCRNGMRLFWRWDWEGEIAPEHGAAIIVSNHESHLDPFFVGGAMTRPIRWMSKKENFKTPIVRSLFKNHGSFELDRDTPDEGWDYAKRILMSGQFIGIFPEGTRSVDNELGDFKTGAIRLALEMGVPIVPCAVTGSANSLPKGKLIMKPSKVRVRVGKPIYYDDYYGKDISYPEIKRLTTELRDEVTRVKDELEGKTEELSIGYPKDMENKSSSFNPMRLLKKFGKSFATVLDDMWYGLLKSLELVGARFAFSKPIYGLTGIILDFYTPLANPIKMIDFEKHIPAEGGAIIACGHNSEWDVLMIDYCVWKMKNRRHCYQMAKDSLFRIPLVNAWVRTHWAFPLRRGAHDVSSFNYAKEVLGKGELLVVYPEGTTNEGGGKLLEGHTGAVRLAIEAKSSIIPVGVTGTEDIFPKRGKMLNLGKGCIFKAGEPFMEHAKYFDKPLPDYDELKRLTNNLMARIKDLTFYDDPNA